ncbi:MAG: hypothetical protein P8Y69_00415, partial [Gammaproteobacteria bacterium]
FLSYPGKPDRARPDERLLGLGPTDRLYQCGDEGWVFLALVSRREKERFIKTVAAAGLGCLRADGPLPATFWLEDPQAQALSLTAPVEHPDWGPYRRHGPLAFFNRAEPVLGPPPLAGQHNDEVLGALGYSPEDIEQLRSEGVIG